MVTLEACDRLFANLRQHGFEVGVDAHLALADLWLNLLARGQDPATDPERLARLIGPLVCASPHDQLVFPRLFDAWWASEQAQAAPRPNRVAAQLLALPGRTRWSWLIVIALPIALIAIWALLPSTVVNLQKSVKQAAEKRATKNIRTSDQPQTGENGSKTDPEELVRSRADTPPEVAVQELRIRRRLEAMREQGYDAAKLTEFEREAEQLLARRTSTQGSVTAAETQSPGARQPLSGSADNRPNDQAPVEQRQEQRPWTQVQSADPSAAAPLYPTARDDLDNQARRDPLLALDTRLGQWHCQQQLAELESRIAFLGLEAKVLSGPEHFYQRIHPYLPFLPLLLALPFGLWFQRQANALEQRRAQAGTQAQQINVPAEEQELYASSGFRRTLQAMGVHRVVGSRQIDVAATIRATGQRGGIISPVQGQSRRLPEYLMLVDRHEADSHGARMAEVLAQQLSGGGLYVDVLYFDRDPRQCINKEGDRHYPARDLQQRFQDYRLLICSDGAGLVDPFTLEPLPWLTFLNTWPHRTLLSPTEFWGYRERALAETGLWTLPMTETGLAQFMEFVLLESPPKLPDSKLNLFPSLLLERPNYWFTRAKPDDRLLARLLDQLRTYLGDDFTWLAACAVYPSLHWEITLLLGQAIDGENAQGRELRLLTLVRLPWFNRGFMPNWLRQALIETLPPALEQRLRALLQKLLAGGALTGDRPGFKLEVHRELPVSPESAQKVSAPNRDQVFLRFLTRTRSQRLALRLPRDLRALLFHRGDPFSGPRWLWIGLLTLGACLLLRLGLPQPNLERTFHLPKFVAHDQERAEMGPYFLVTALSQQTLGELRNPEQTPEDYLFWLQNYLHEQADGNYFLLVKPPQPTAQLTRRASSLNWPNSASPAVKVESDTVTTQLAEPLCLTSPVTDQLLIPGERPQLIVSQSSGEVCAFVLDGRAWLPHWSTNLGQAVDKLAIDPSETLLLARTNYLCMLDLTTGQRVSLAFDAATTTWDEQSQWATALDQQRLVLAVYDKIYPDFLMEQPSQNSGAHRHLVKDPVAGEALVFRWAAPPLPPPYDITWDFGDGARAWGPDVQHTYANAGPFTIALTYRTGLTVESLERKLNVAPAVEKPREVATKPVVVPQVQLPSPARRRPDADALRKEVLRILAKRVPIRALTLSESGRFALLDGSAQVWLWEDQANPPLKAFSFASSAKSLYALAFSPDGSKLAIAGDNGFLALRNLSTGENLIPARREADSFGAIGFLDNDQLVSAGSDQTLRFWRATRLAKWKALDTKQGDINILAISPDRQHIASAGGNAVRIWGTTGKPLQEFRPGPAIAAVAFSPKGNLCAAACDDRTIRIWDLDEPKAGAIVLQRKAPATQLGFLRNGSLAIAERNAISLLDLATKSERRLDGQLGQITTMATTTGGRLILAADNTGTIHLWNDARASGELLILPDRGWFLFAEGGTFDAADATLAQLEKAWNLTDFSFAAYRKQYKISYLKRK